MELVNKSVRFSDNGLFLVLLGATLFSMKGILIKLAYQYGVESTVLMTLRMLFSLPLYLIILFLEIKKYRPQKLGISSILWVSVVGICGYYLASWFDLKGLEYLPANIGRLVLYTYPALVVLMSVIVFKKPLNRRMGGVLLLIYFGLVVVLIPPLLLAAKENILTSDFFTGVMLTLLSAFSFAIYLIGCEKMMRGMSSRLFTSIAISAASVAIVIHYFSYYPALYLLKQPVQVYGYGLAIAFFCTVLPSFLMASGIERLGASNASAITTVSPVVTLIFAFFILGESLNILQLVGFGIVILGIYKLSSINMGDK